MGEAVRASGSRLPLLVQCGYTMRPEVVMPPATSGAAAVRGIARHADFEAWTRGTTVESAGASEWPDAQAAKLRFLLELGTRYPAASVHGGAVGWERPSTEVIMVLDVLSGVVRESEYRRSHEDPDTRPSEIRLVADVASGDLVIDYKTGRPIEGASVQTRALALAWARLRGITSVRAALAYIDDAGRWWRYDEESLDAFDLSEVAEQLRALYEHEASHAPRPGPWCRDLYCPLAGTCPATAPALVHAAGGMPVPSLDPQTPEEVTALYLARSAVRAWERDAFAALQRWADSGRTVQIGNGREWGRVESRGAERVTLTAEGRAYLADTLPDALEVSTTKTAINGCAPRAKAREVLARLGELGCLSSKTSVKYEEIEK
jgi:hypothetical protein